MTHRKVLVLQDESSIHNLMTLLKRLWRENALVETSRRVLTAVDRKLFDTAVLDLRCPVMHSHEEIRGIKDVHIALVGKQLVITAEVNGPKSLNLVERFISNGLPQTLLWLVSYRYQPPRQDL